MKYGILFVLAFFAPSISPVGPNVTSIIQCSVAANEKDWQAAPEYSYRERDWDPEGTKTYRDFMLHGSPYQYLITENGKPLSPEEQANEQQKLEQTSRQRENESPEQKQARISKYQDDRKRNHLMMEQLTDAFEFKLLGEQKLDGFDVYVLSATPRPGYQPPNMETKALTGMRGKLWIDEKTSQWVKVTAEVVHPVTVEGFLARIEPGTRFELEKVPVGDGVWLPSHFSMRSRARIFFIFPRRREEDEKYFGYQKGTSQH